MITTVSALVLRIFSNPAANLFQKLLAEKYSSTVINFYTFLFMSLLCVPVAVNVDWTIYPVTFWIYVIVAGFFCTLGTICLIKALQIGELSVLAPINSYKCIIGLISAFFLLGEIPSMKSIFGLILIVYGSRFLFDTIEEKFSWKIFKRKDIMLRFLALIFTGCEAAILKKIIIMSSFQISFILWAFSGLLISFLLLFCGRHKRFVHEKTDYLKIFCITICLSVMQLSTNYVFQTIEVGSALALFQLSSPIALIFGYKYFHEKDVLKKFLGTAIMILGAALILITG